MTRPALRLVVAGDLYVTDAAATPRVVMLDGHDRRTIDRHGVLDALVVLPQRSPRSGMRRKVEMDMEEWT